MTKFLLCFVAIAFTYSAGFVNGWVVSGEVSDRIDSIPLIGGF